MRILVTKINFLFFTLAVGVLALSSVQTKASGSIFDGREIVASAKKNGRFCNLGSWYSSWLGPQNSVRSYPTISIQGDDLTNYASNVDATIILLYRMNVAAARSGNITPLKNFMLSMAKQSHFTKLQPYRPKTWNGTKPAWISKYNSYNEPAYAAALLLIAAAQSFAILEPHLSADEQKLLSQWGTKVFKASANARDSKKGVDRMAAKAAAFTSWGLVTGNSTVFGKGKSRFRSTVKDIRKDGRSKFFSTGHKGKELNYMNATYGHLSVAAAALEAKGEKGFAYSSGGGSLIDGLNFLISRSLNPSLRTQISKTQKDMRWIKGPRNGNNHSWAYMEFVAHSAAAVQNMPLLPRALRIRGGAGFFGGSHGGYTSCLMGR